VSRSTRIMAELRQQLLLAKSGSKPSTTKSSQSHHQNDLSQQWEDAIAGIIKQIDSMDTVTTAAQAVESLKATGGEHAKPHVHAMYLQKVPESPGFTRKEVTIYLSELDEDDELLTAYFNLVHFGDVSIIESLRAYYTALRLVQLRDTAAMNRLLYGLATAFKDNGGRFDGDLEDCVRIYSAMIMLNDSLHNNVAVGRARMTQQRFMEIINDHNETEIAGFGEAEMRRLFASVQQYPVTEKVTKSVAIEIEDDGAGHSQRTHNVPDDSATPPQMNSSRCCVIL